jgi:hypothetical protein
MTQSPESENENDEVLASPLESSSSLSVVSNEDDEVINDEEDPGVPGLLSSDEASVEGQGTSNAQLFSSC